MDLTATPETRNTFQETILSWYAKHKRDLPWRKTDDPYRILVSEIMLQQTQVDRVIPKYEAFLAVFPDVFALAAARTGDVLVLWSGLGYNRRALYLQKAAQTVVDRNGTFPQGSQELRKLPGIGPYTAAALQSFAFHQDVPVVDTNIRRIFSRIFFSGAGTQALVDQAVAAAVPQGYGTDWNNALMDFGSLMCTASTPRCSDCPLRSMCSAYQAGRQEQYLRIAPPQKKFAGSKRQYRGRILKMLKDAKNGKILLKHIYKKLGLETDKTDEILRELIREGLLTRKGNAITLP